MRLRLLVLAAVWPAALLAASGGGCSPGSSPAAEGADAYAPCPGSLAATVGAACSVEGAVCTPSYECGITPAPARCTCTAGVYACSDFTGAAIAGPDTQPACPAKVDAQACPASERLASGALCTEIGLLCTYLAPCDATPALDQCQCSSGGPSTGGGSTAGGGGTGLRFQCTSACTYAGPPASPDAGAEASPTSDGAAPDHDTPTPEAAPDGPVDSGVSEAAG